MEKASGTSRNGRPELELLLEFMREGDELVVTRIDRLARVGGGSAIPWPMANGVLLARGDAPRKAQNRNGAKFESQKRRRRLDVSRLEGSRRERILAR